MRWVAVVSMSPLSLSTAWRTTNCAISHPLLNEGTCMREYSIGLISNGETKCVQLTRLSSTHVCTFLR
jgi:hypothetical protein